MFYRQLVPSYPVYPILPYGGLSVLSGNTFTAGDVTATVSGSSNVAINVNVQAGNTVSIGCGFYLP